MQIYRDPETLDLRLLHIERFSQQKRMVPTQTRKTGEYFAEGKGQGILLGLEKSGNFT